MTHEKIGTDMAKASVAWALEALDSVDTVREGTFKKSREVVRESSSIIKGVHRGVPADRLATKFAAAKGSYGEILEIASEHPEVMNSSAAVTAGQELTEAALVLAIAKGEGLPGATSLGVAPSAYLMGIADTIGEVRRMCLDSMREGDLDRSEMLLELMEELFDMVMEVDLPHAIIPIKPKQDAARHILERTRGDVTFAVTAKRFSNNPE